MKTCIGASTLGYRGIYATRLLLESQAIIPRVYRKVESVMSEFEMVFTHSSADFLRSSRTLVGFLAGESGLAGPTRVGPWGSTQKSRGVSMLTSNKLKTHLHRQRYAIAWRIQRSGGPVDVYRQPIRSGFHVSVDETVRDYRYSICMENFVDDAYFTEKLLNCFAAGTVPVYLGARRVGEFFDQRGIIPFTDYGQLVHDILPTLSEQDYESRREAIAANFEACRKYRSVEDFIYDRYLGTANAEPRGLSLGGWRLDCYGTRPM